MPGDVGRQPVGARQVNRAQAGAQLRADLVPAARMGRPADGRAGYQPRDVLAGQSRPPLRRVADEATLQLAHGSHARDGRHEPNDARPRSLSLHPAVGSDGQDQRDAVGGRVTAPQSHRLLLPHALPDRVTQRPTRAKPCTVHRHVPMGTRAALGMPPDPRSRRRGPASASAHDHAAAELRPLPVTALAGAVTAAAGSLVPRAAGPAPPAGRPSLGRRCSADQGDSAATSACGAGIVPNRPAW